MRQVIVIIVVLLMASFAKDSAGRSLKIVDIYPKMKAHIANCSEAHGFDPSMAIVDEHALAPGEKPWRECAYRGIEEYIIGHSTVPQLYKQIVAEDRAMTEQIALGELTRTARRSRLEFLIELIREKEINERAILMTQAQELTDFVNRQRQFEEIARMQSRANQNLRAIRAIRLH